MKFSQTLVPIHHLQTFKNNITLQQFSISNPHIPLNSAQAHLLLFPRHHFPPMQTKWVHNVQHVIYIYHFSIRVGETKWSNSSVLFTTWMDEMFRKNRKFKLSFLKSSLYRYFSGDLTRCKWIPCISNTLIDASNLKRWNL